MDDVCQSIIEYAQDHARGFMIADIVEETGVEFEAVKACIYDLIKNKQIVETDDDEYVLAENAPQEEEATGNGNGVGRPKAIDEKELIGFIKSFNESGKAVATSDIVAEFTVHRNVAYKYVKRLVDKGVAKSVSKGQYMLSEYDIVGDEDEEEGEEEEEEEESVFEVLTDYIEKEMEKIRQSMKAYKNVIRAIKKEEKKIKKGGEDE